MQAPPAGDTSPFADIADALLTRKRAIVTAVPGSGKTTQLPQVLGESLRRTGDARQIWVLEPRRIAARLAATYVAEQRNSVLGGEVGFRVRFEERVGPNTQIVYMTYGVFIRLLQRDPSLARVAAILFDEFHERSWQQDASLAATLALDARTSNGPAIAILSATVDAHRLADALGGAALCSLSGNVFPVTYAYAALPRRLTLEAHAATAVRTQLAERKEGHLLVFLPGPKEILGTQRLLSDITSSGAVAVLPLFSRLPEAAQREALAPRQAPVRKVVLATNIAESSVTIDGVHTVIDSGLSYQAEQDAFSGVSSLRLRPISQASATQRAGRAGRQGPGHCVRLFGPAEAKRRPAFDVPQMSRADLSEPWLWLLSIGLSPTELPWLDPPPEARSKAAYQTLYALGACTLAGELTPLGAQLAALPLHPRLGRVALAAAELGVARRTLARVLAVLEDPHADDRARLLPPVVVPSDAEEALLRVDHVPRWRESSRQHEQMLGKPWAASSKRPVAADALERALLAGFVDRVARRLPPLGPTPGLLPLAMAGGGSARLHEASGVRDDEFIVCLAGRIYTGPGPHGLRITMAAAVDPARLLDAFPPWLSEQDRTVLTAGGRVLRQQVVTFAGLPLLESETLEADPVRRAQALSGALVAQWRQHRTLQDKQEQLCARLTWLARARPALASAVAALDVEACVLQAVQHMVQGASALGDVKPDDVWSLLQLALPQDVQRGLATDAPTHVHLASGKRLPVHWQANAPPYVASFLQDFVGQHVPLTFGDAKLRLTVHLWAPNRRPLQITDDLQSFWQTHYPALKKQLSRRYPRHKWP